LTNEVNGTLTTVSWRNAGRYPVGSTGRREGHMAKKKNKKAKKGKK